jgi:hypothetical protein
MKFEWRFLSVIVPAAFLLLSGCADSKNPLCDPQTSKADERLLGVWRERDEDGGVTYYHVGRVGKKLPGGMMWAVFVQHNKREVELPGVWLIFPTILGGKSYLNLTDASRQRLNLLKEKGWKPEADDHYFILKYQVQGDTLLLSSMDKDAKERAIKGGKIKGAIEKDEGKWVDRVEFTDSTENVARLVAEAGDSLFSKEQVRRLERVDAAKKPQISDRRMK